MEVASSPSASLWLSAIPIQEYGFAHDKGNSFVMPSASVMVSSHVYIHLPVFVTKITAALDLPSQIAMQWEQTLPATL